MVEDKLKVRLVEITDADLGALLSLAALNERISNAQGKDRHRYLDPKEIDADYHEFSELKEILIPYVKIGDSEVIRRQLEYGERLYQRRTAEYRQIEGMGSKTNDGMEIKVRA